jgi:hypothetical protein
MGTLNAEPKTQQKGKKKRHGTIKMVETQVRSELE